MKLPNHDYIQQTTPDAMHTIKDVVEHILKLLVGKKNSTKMITTEIQLSRFGLEPVAESTSSRKRKRGGSKSPFQLSDAEKKLADERACSILAPSHTDYIPGVFFSKSSHLKSHDWKQVHSLDNVRKHLTHTASIYIILHYMNLSPQ